MYGKEVSTSLCGLLTNVSTIMREVNTVEALVQCPTESYICTGNGDEKFHELSSTRKGIFLDQHSTYTHVHAQQLQ